MDSDFKAYLDRLSAATTLSDFLRKRMTLKKRGREWVGLCPFHNEKTPSFYVNDAKNFYHCFGCGAHGDALKWFIAKDGMHFIEAVRALAHELGLPPPPQRKRTEREQRQEQQQERFLRLMESAARWYSAALYGAEAESARRYLESDRGLTQEIYTQFRLGYAPADGRDFLAHLRGEGFSDKELVESGLARENEGARGDKDKLRSFFFNRIIFPISNGRGQVVSFGGRALSPEMRAKYLNGADSIIFSKGQLLYNLHNADPILRKGESAWIVEGYMDVLALARVGIETAVAPLGTSLTQEQLRLLFRRTDAPLFCMDGDEAGRRAAIRTIETAMPLLTAGKTLRFVLLPAGQDPDDFVRGVADGKAALKSLADSALSLTEFIWRVHAGRCDFTAPEKVALLDSNINALTRQIENESVRRVYQSEFNRRIKDACWKAGRKKNTHTSTQINRYTEARSGGSGDVAEHAAALRADLLLNRESREVHLLALAVKHPWLVGENYESLSGLPERVAGYTRLRMAILDAVAEEPNLDSEGLIGYLEGQGFSSILAKVLESRGAEGVSVASGGALAGVRVEGQSDGQNYGQTSVQNDGQESGQDGEQSQEDEQAERAKEERVIRAEFDKYLRYYKAGESQNISFWRRRGRRSIERLLSQGYGEGHGEQVEQK